MFDGKVALVTGGGTGIGRAVARALAAHGAGVAVLGRRPGPLAQIAVEIGALSLVADVAREDEVAESIDRRFERFGRLDILVNNAGVAGPTAPVERMDAVEWDAVFAVNVRGAALCIKHAVPLMRLGGSGGAIVNIASDAVLRPKPGRAAYAASKCALVGLTRAVAQELGRSGIRVNAVLPGATETEMLSEVLVARAVQQGLPGDAVRDQLRERTALGRIATPEEIAAAVLFLAGNGAASLTGTTLVVDAGQL